MRLSEETKTRIAILDQAGWTINKIATLLGIKWESVQRVIRKGVPKKQIDAFINRQMEKIYNDQKVPTIGGVRVTGPKARAVQNRKARKVAGSK